MRIRSDYVTNSSSSSFIINVNKYKDDDKKWELDDIKEVLKIMLDSYNKIYFKNYKFEDVFGYVGEPTDDELNKAFDNAYYDGNAPYDVYDNRLKMNIETTLTYKDIVKNGEFVVFSKQDNSIPYELYGYIESVLKATKLHLG